MTQAAITFSPPEPPPSPTPSDPSIAPPARRRVQSYNRELLAALLTGTHVRSDELGFVGKRYSARLGDIRAWLRANGWDGGDPLPRHCVDGEAKVWSWRLTGRALELARRIVAGERQ